MRRGRSGDTNRTVWPYLVWSAGKMFHVCRWRGQRSFHQHIHHLPTKVARSLIPGGSPSPFNTVPRTHFMSSTSAYSSPSPAESSSSATVRPTSTRDESPTMEPPRKRARSDLTPEQRRDARAHRNRIAAQNSRDKRKAQFAYLESRVAELEEENRRLRAGTDLSQFASAGNKSINLEAESVQARENRELKERIKSLESGWSAVIKALQASGLPLNIQVPPPASSHSLPTSTSPAGSLPTIVPSPPTAYPLSPATSTSSLPSSNIFEEFESTRHLARVATVESGAQLTSTSLQRVDSRRTIISPNSTSLLHPPRRRLPQTTQSRNRSATALWRSSFGRSLPPHLRHQLRLSPSKFSPQTFKLLPTSRRHPSSRRR